jgi:hypothetical protein
MVRVQLGADGEVSCPAAGVQDGVGGQLGRDEDGIGGGRASRQVAGTKLPILAELAARYGCRTDTAQKVLQLLEADGLAARIPGKGYYSRRP